MTSIFDRWTDLDPALALRRIEAAHGSAIFDRDSYLDPQRALRQIENALGIELDDVLGLQSPSSIEAAVDAALADTGGGGGGAPEWVPATAKIYIDLVNNRAWTEADGEVAIDTLLGADANTDNYWGATSYSSGDLTTDGLVSANPSALIGSALTRLLAGATTRLQYKIVDNNTDTYRLIMMSADGNAAIQCQLSDVAVLFGDAAGASLLLSDPGSGLQAAGDHNAVAFTLTKPSSTARAELSLNADAAVSTTISAADWPESGSGQLVAALVAMGIHVALQSITIYDALPDTTGLSALSATE